MPSGSKKRKSSKKPKPPGGPPELEAGLEEAMENNGLEVGEATPSPRGFEGDPEAMAERCLQEGKEMNGKAPQERDAVPEVPKEGFQTDEAAPDQGEEGQGSPPSQAEPELKIPAGIEAEAPAVFELEGEPAQGETKLQIDTPPMEFEVKTDAAPEEIKPETELDAVPAESEPVSDAAPEEIKPEMESHAMPVEPESVTDASPDASPDEIKPDSYIGLDEIESSKESSILERESVLDAAPIGSESGMDESSVAMETKTDAASADIEPEIYKARDEVKPETDAAPAIESEISEPLVEVKPEADATPYIELETNDAPIGSESGMDESSVATETKTDVASADIEPEIYKAPDEVKAETDAAPAIESEISEPLVEVKPEADATPYIELETNDASYEVPVEVEPEMDGAPVESKPETEAAQVEELEPAAPAEIEPETEEALMERELETDAAPTDVEAEAEEALAETEVAIDAAPVDVEPVMDAAPADAEAETDTAQVEIDASPDEIPPEIDAASPENERIEIEPDVNAAPVEAEQDEAAIEAAPEPESEVEGEPEVIAEDADTSAEVEAETEPPPETEPEPKPLDVAEDTSLQPPQEIELLEVAADTSLEPPQGIEPLDVADDTSLEPPQEIEPESEVVATAEAKPEEEASVETKAEERGSAEAESDQQDLVEGEMEAPLEINPEPEAQPSREIELDAEAELPLEAEPEPVAEARAEAESEAEPSRGIEMDAEAEVPLEAEPEPVAEAPAEAEPEEKGSIETESYQQDLGEIEPDQQLQKQEGGEAELGELDTSVSEDNQPSESQPQVADAPELPVIEDEPPAISPVDDFSSSTSSSEPEAQPSREIELDAESELPLEAEPEPVAEAPAKAESEAEPSRGIEMDAEAEVPLEAEPEPVAEAPAEAEPEEKGPIETESYQQDLGEIEPNQQLQKQEGGEAELGELDTSVSEDNQPSESQPQVADAPELPVIEDEPPAISPVDDFSSSTSSSEPEAQPSREIELDAEAELPLKAEPEPVAEARAEAESEVEPSRGIEMDAEAEVPLEAEPEPVAEAPAEAEPEEKGPIETESYQQDLGEIEPDQQLQKQEGGEAELGELDTSVSEDNQPSESQPQVADAPELPVIEDEPPAISPVDDFSSSTSSSEASDNVNNERTASEQEPEEGDDIPPSAKASEGEGHSTVEGVSDNQGAFEQKAVDVGHDGDGAVLVPAGNGIETEKSSEQESAIEPPPADVEEYAQEDISKQERSVDVGHDEDGAVLASAGNGGEAEESSEQELAIELPSADVEESAKEEISEQERAVDVGHDEDGAVLASAGNGGKVEVSSEQELGIELPPADVVDLEELAKDGPPSSDQGPVTEQPQPLVDEQDLSQGLGTAADEPLSAESEQSLNATLAPSASEMTSDAPDTQEEVITLANEEKVALEHAFNLESACGELERDIGEEEAVSSTVVEVGSVLNDFDERTSYEQELHTDFPSVDQEVDIPSAESDQSLNAITAVAPEPQDETVIPANDDEKVALEHEFKLESACGELERDIGEEVMVASSTGGEAGSVLNDFDERASYEQELHTDFPSSTHQDVDIPDFKEYDGNVSTEAYEAEAGLREQVESEPSLAEKVDESAVEATSEQRDVLLEGAEAGKPAEDSPQPKQVVHDNGDQAHSSKEVVLPNEELRTGEEERATCEDGRVAANSIFGNSLAIIAGDELISKASTCLENGQQSLSSSEAPSNERVEHIYESSIHQSEVNNMDKAEIHAMDAKELKEAEHNPMGGDTNIDANKVLVESAPLIPEGKYTKGAQAFRQESTKEASLPVVVPAQDRALEHVSLKSAERPSGGGALERRTKLLGCCGMFDLLLGRN